MPAASCCACASCREGLGQDCEPGFTATSNGPEPQTGGHTLCGYASHVVVDRRFVPRIPEGPDLAGVAPLLCAGITTCSPPRHRRVTAGRKVGVVGPGGLGRMGVKIAHAMGAHVVLFTTSPGKEADARRLGAAEVVVARDPAAMAAQGETCAFILDTVAAEHDVDADPALLKRDGTPVQVGAPEEPLAMQVLSVIGRRRTFAGSLVGAVAETQEMLGFCVAHGATADIEMIPIGAIETAYARTPRSDVTSRFVVDMASDMASLPRAA